MGKKMICFDMDGTIADLYNVPNWLEKIRANDISPYRDAKPMWNMIELNSALVSLADWGWEIRVISWLPMNADEQYKDAVARTKKDWLDRYYFPCAYAHCVQYGTTKANCVRKIADAAILIDDNEKVRNGWKLGKTLDPTKCDLIAELEKIIEKGKGKQNYEKGSKYALTAQNNILHDLITSPGI